jgi:YggT family protein
MAALIYLIETLLSLCLIAVLLRLLLQWSRADFRNPLARSIIHLTNPIIVPLRRLLPSIGRLDTASCVAVAVFALLQVSVSWLVSGLGPPPAWCGCNSRCSKSCAPPCGRISSRS